MATFTLVEHLRREVFSKKEEEEETEIQVMSEPLDFDPDTSGVMLMPTKGHRIELVREALWGRRRIIIPSQGQS